MSKKTKKTEKAEKSESESKTEKNDGAEKLLTIEQTVAKSQLDLAKIHTSLGWHRFLILTCFGALFSIVFYNRGCDPHPITSETGRHLTSISKRSRTLLLLTLRERLVESARRISFSTSHNVNDYYISTTIDQSEALRDLLQSDQEYKHLSELTLALKEMVSTDHADRDSAERRLQRVGGSRAAEQDLRILSLALLGTAKTIRSLNDDNKYSKDAEDTFKLAEQLSASGLKLGLISNGLGIQRTLYAANLFAEVIPSNTYTTEMKRVELRTGYNALQAAHRLFITQNSIDRTSRSLFKQFNNQNWAACARLYSVIQSHIAKVDGAEQEAFPNGRLAFFSRTEQNLQRCHDVAMEDPTAADTASEYWALKGEYFASVRKDKESADSCFTKSKEMLLLAIRQGMTSGYSTSVKAIDSICNKNLFRREMLKQDNNRAEIEAAIRRLSSN